MKFLLCARPYSCAVRTGTGQAAVEPVTAPCGARGACKGERKEMAGQRPEWPGPGACDGILCIRESCSALENLWMGSWESILGSLSPVMC